MKLWRASSVAFAAIAAAAPITIVVQTGCASPAAGSGPVRMNELQVIGTHNSYKRELSEVEQASYDEIIETPGDYFEFLL
jgi:hypothetical protein